MAAILAFLGAITSFLSPFSAALGAGASWLVSLFISKQQAQAQAASDMNQSIADHAQDGQESVAINDSADQQLANIKQQQDALNQPTKGVK